MRTRDEADTLVAAAEAETLLASRIGLVRAYLDDPPGTGLAEDYVRLAVLLISQAGTPGREEALRLLARIPGDVPTALLQIHFDLPGDPMAALARELMAGRRPVDVFAVLSGVRLADGRPFIAGPDEQEEPDRRPPHDVDRAPDPFGARAPASPDRRAPGGGRRRWWSRRARRPDGPSAPAQPRQAEPPPPPPPPPPPQQGHPAPPPPPPQEGRTAPPPQQGRPGPGPQQGRPVPGPPGPPGPQQGRPVPGPQQRRPAPRPIQRRPDPAPEQEPGDSGAFPPVDVPRSADPYDQRGPHGGGGAGAVPPETDNPDHPDHPGHPGHPGQPGHRGQPGTAPPGRAAGDVDRAVPAPERTSGSAPGAAGDRTPGATVHPRLDAPPEALPGASFVVTLGLRGEADPELVSAGDMTVAVDEPDAAEIQVALTFDPAAFAFDGDDRGPWTLRRTAATPWPAVEVRLLARRAEGLRPERRVDAKFLRDGVLLGFASRAVLVHDAPQPPEHPPDQPPDQPPRPSGARMSTFQAPAAPAESAASRARHPVPVPAPAPAPGPAPVPDAAGGTGADPWAAGGRARAGGRTGRHTGFTLDPVLAGDAPDLTIYIRHADDVGRHRLVFTASSAHPDVPDTVAPLTESLGDADLGDTPERLGADARLKVMSTADPVDLFHWLHGFGVRIGRVLPEPVRAALRAAVARGTPDAPASVLVLSEEPHVPWELAVVNPGWGRPDAAGSPFLGAHAAIGRWVLADAPPPPPRPHTRTRVAGAAVVTARYEGVLGWERLEHAEAEAAWLAERLGPSAVVVPPRLADVLEVLGGEPGADLLHFALHGTFDPGGLDRGLVLVGERGGRPAPQLLQEEHVLSAQLRAQPFVYLNACQVAAGGEVLGDYGGLAGAFLTAGAGAVLAPLWNVADETASAMAREFYERSAVADPPPVGEILRRFRARYTLAAVREGRPGVDAALVSFQLFGHPRLQLHAVDVPDVPDVPDAPDEGAAGHG